MSWGTTSPGFAVRGPPPLLGFTALVSSLLGDMGVLLQFRGIMLGAGDEGSFCFNRKLVFWFFLFCFPIRSEEAQEGVWLPAPLLCRMKSKYPLHRQGAVLSHGELWVKDHCSSLRKNRVEASGW